MLCDKRHARCLLKVQASEGEYHRDNTVNVKRSTQEDMQSVKSEMSFDG